MSWTCTLHIYNDVPHILPVPGTSTASLVINGTVLEVTLPNPPLLPLSSLQYNVKW